MSLLNVLVGVTLLSICIQASSAHLPSSAAGYAVYKCGEEQHVDNLKEHKNLAWWIELGDKLITGLAKGINDANNCQQMSTYAADRDVYVLQKNRHQDTPELLHVLPQAEIIASGWGFYVITVPAAGKVVFEQLSGWRIIPITTSNVTLVKTHTPAPISHFVNTAIDDLVAKVDGKRWFSALTQLATYNRYTRGTGIADAQAWIVSQLEEVQKVNSNLTVTLQPFSVGSTTAYNIVATFKGYEKPDWWVIIGGHYDSTSQSPTTAAPGAEDNASGAAAVLEMVRVFATNPPPTTAIFIFFSGEEQGLYGSSFDAAQIVRNGQTSNVQLMHNMDMIAYKAASNPNYEVLLETNKPFDTLFPIYTESAGTYTTLKYAFGSDHEPYLERGMPGLLTIDGDWDSYPNYHRTTDTPDKCNEELGFQIIKMGVGAIAKKLGYL